METSQRLESILRGVNDPSRANDPVAAMALGEEAINFLRAHGATLMVAMGDYRRMEVIENLDVRYLELVVPEELLQGDGCHSMREVVDAVEVFARENPDYDTEEGTADGAEQGQRDEVGEE